MSDRWRVQTSGKPYLAFLQNSFDTMTPSLLFGGFGIVQLEAEFAVHGALPVQSASLDEVHPVFSFHDAFVGNQTLLAVGVTPSGRVAAVSPDGTGPFTSINRVRADGVFIKAAVSHDGGAGATTLVLNDGAESYNATTGLQFAVPATFGRFCAFNGSRALTNCRLSLRRVAAYGFGGSAAEWLFTETEGSVLKATKSGGTGWDIHNLDLTAQFAGAVSGATPWGVVPSTSPENEFAWHLKTPWVKQAPKVTPWRRSKITWPS